MYLADIVAHVNWNLKNFLKKRNRCTELLCSHSRLEQREENMVILSIY